MAISTATQSPTQDALSGVSPSQDNTSRCARDQRIRSRGWRIHSRVRDNEPLWIKEGVVLPEQAVLRRIDSEVKELEAGYSGLGRNKKGR
jgi:hypothetical protein